METTLPALHGRGIVGGGGGGERGRRHGRQRVGRESGLVDGGSRGGGRGLARAVPVVVGIDTRAEMRNSKITTMIFHLPSSPSPSTSPSFLPTPSANVATVCQSLRAIAAKLSAVS